MSRSFFTGTDAELRAGSNTFSALISERWFELGLAESDAVAYAELDAVYTAAYLAAIAPATRTRGTVIAKNDAKVKLKILASHLAKIINANRQVTSAQKIALGLNVPAQRSPMAAPGSPRNFSFTLFAIGWIELRWKCGNPVGAHGTIYQVSRRIGGGGFEFLGTSGKKKFVDATIPAGTSSVTYQVQAIRSTVVGPPAQYNINFGGSGGGAMMASMGNLTTAKPSKIAA